MEYDSTGWSGHGVPVWYGSAEETDYSEVLHHDPLVETIWGQYIEEGAEPDVAESWAISAARKLREAEEFSAESDCPLCSEKIDFEEAYIELPHSLCDGCYDAVMEKRHDHAYSAEVFEAPVFDDAAMIINNRKHLANAMEKIEFYHPDPSSGPYNIIYCDASGSMQQSIGGSWKQVRDSLSTLTMTDVMWNVIVEGVEAGVIDLPFTVISFEAAHGNWPGGGI